MKCALDFNTEAFPLVTQIEMWKCSHSAPEVRPGRHPVPAAAGFSQLSKFWWDEPLQANSPGEAGSAEPSHSPAAAGHDRAWDTTSQLTQHQPYLKVGATKLKILQLEREGCRIINVWSDPSTGYYKFMAIRHLNAVAKLAGKQNHILHCCQPSQIRALTPRAVKWDSDIIRKIFNKTNINRKGGYA